jgi:Tol biopolymer transport system component
VVLALGASAIAGFLFMRAAMLRHAHSMSQSAVAATATVPAAPTPQGAEVSAPERAVASTGRTDAVQPLVPARAFSPAFAADGRAVYFQTGDPRDPTSAIAMAPLGGSADAGTPIRRIVDEGSRNFHARPSPDGRLLAFDSDRDGARGVYVAERDGSSARRISGDGYAALPAWSPDGSRLAYVRAEAGRPSVWNLWVRPLDGPPRRITRYAYGQTWSASWFPDNRRICYTHEDALIVLDLENGRWRRFRSPVQGRLVRTPAVSPDGTTIVFQVFRDGAWTLDMRDGSMRRVLADPTAEEFAWAPDGARVAFHSRRDGEWGIYVLPRG